MFARLRSLFGAPSPAGPPQMVKRFSSADPVLSGPPLQADGAGWHANLFDGQTLHFFEFVPPPLEQCLITYRAQIKAEGLSGKAYLELWCRLPGRGEFFSRGLQQALTGTCGWVSCEVPFYLERGQSPDLLKLNRVAEGAGRLWIKNIELSQTPLL